MRPLVFNYEQAFLMFKWNGRMDIECRDGSREKTCNSIKQARRFYKAWSKEKRKIK